MELNVVFVLLTIFFLRNAMISAQLLSRAFPPSQRETHLSDDLNRTEVETPVYFLCSWHSVEL